jgi:hypothetical protein
MHRWPALTLLALFLCGCGTTRRTDSPRTATEQLLISGAVDQALENVRLDALKGTKVFLDEKYAKAPLDLEYVLFSVREKLLLEGALLVPSEDQADVVVQVAIGALGTDRYEVLVGMPEVHSLGYISPDFPLPPALPEVPLLKAMNQHGVAKIRILAYRRNTGQLIALSGDAGMSTTHNRSTWFVGIGPIEEGMGRDHPSLAGKPIPLPSIPGIVQQPSEEAGQEPPTVPELPASPIRSALRDP